MADLPDGVPAIVLYLASILEYCPIEGAFYTKPNPESSWMESKGELNGVPICCKKKLTKGKNYGKLSLMVRAGPRHNRRAVLATKLSWYMSTGEWPYIVKQRAGYDDLRVSNMHAVLTLDEYMESMGDPYYWDGIWKKTPPNTHEKTCQVRWYPGLAPDQEEV